MRRILSFLALVPVTGLVLGLVACQAKSPEEQVAEQRAQYTVTLNSWFARIDNLATEEPVDDMEAMESEVGDEPAEEPQAEEPGDVVGDEMAAEPVPMGPQPHTIVFDLLVQFDGRGAPLPGVTVEVTHAGADGTTKGSWLEFLEVPGIAKGTSKQVGIERSGVLFEEGDVFAVSLEKNVPPAERSGYREFETAGD